MIYLKQWQVTQILMIFSKAKIQIKLQTKNLTLMRVIKSTHLLPFVFNLENGVVFQFIIKNFSLILCIIKRRRWKFILALKILHSITVLRRLKEKKFFFNLYFLKIKHFSWIKMSNVIVYFCQTSFLSYYLKCKKGGKSRKEKKRRIMK